MKFWKHWFKDVKQAKSARRNQAVRRLSMQPLESRQMMAVLPELVREINLAGGANPSDLTEVNGTIYFVADMAGTGRELWKSDGTSAGTSLVADIQSGTTGSEPAGLVNVNGTLYFAADDGTTGVELWKSDGTSAGTVLLADINSGVNSSSPTGLVNVGGVLYFGADDGMSGSELWKSDGTSAGTVQVVDINVGTTGSAPKSLTEANGTLYFAANDGVSGVELWHSDGTSAGTEQVIDLNPGASGSNPTGITNIAGVVYFAADDGASGVELWRSNGTTAGTQQVLDINSGATGSNPTELRNINGKLYFAANNGTAGNEPWSSGGTSANTAMLADINAGAGDSEPGGFVYFSGHVFYAADNGTSGAELWKSDATTGGATQLTDVNVAGISQVRNLLLANQRLFFSADDGTNGSELWSFNPATPPNVALSVVGSPMLENASVATVYATLSQTFSQTVTVDLHFAGTATIVDDYSASGTSIAIAPGATTGSVTITSVNDTTYETHETVLVSITNVTNANATGATSVSAIIIDDDLPPLVSLSASSNGLDENGGVNTVIAHLTNASYQDITVSLNLSGTATNGVDYVASSNSILILAGQTSGSITLTNLDDRNYEHDETITVAVSGVTNAFLNGNQNVSASIVNDDLPPAVSLSLGSASLAENTGTSGVSVSLSGTSYQDVTVQLTFTGSATSGVDYTTSTTSVLIPAGQTSATVTLTGIDDLAHEANETIIVGVGAVTNGTNAGAQSVTASITEDDAQPTVTLSINHATRAENGGTAAVIATLSTTSYQDVTVNLTFGGAANNSDYSASTNSIVIPAGQLTAAMTLTGLDDTAYEQSESINVGISGVSNGSQNGTQSVTTSVTDDDTQPAVSLSIANATQSENGGQSTVIATLSNLSYQDVTVQLSFDGVASDGIDYSASSVSILIPAGQTSGSITLSNINDITYESDESVVVDISSVTNGSENGTQSVTATITNDDPIPAVTLALANGTLVENGGVGTVTATLANPSYQDVTVNLSFSGVATFGSDYTSADTIVIPAGETSASINITSIHDKTYETNESIVVDVATVDNGVETGTQAVTLSITNDDTVPTFTMSITNATVNENAGVAVVSATLSNRSYQDVTLNLSFTGSATQNVDYSSSALAIVIPAGQISASITLTSVNDTMFELNETIDVGIASVANVIQNGNQSVLANIPNDDAQPVVSLVQNNSAVSENGGESTVTAALTNPSYQDITVNVVFTGTATNGVDYSASSTSVVIPSGATSAVITLSSINDSTYETNETIITDVTTVTNATENGVQQLTTTLTNDDAIPAVSLSVAHSWVAENSGVATVCAHLANPSYQDVTVFFSLSGTATAGTDYSASALNVVIPAGQVTGSISLTAINDLTYEANETMVVDVTSVTNGVETGTQSVTATICNDDPYPMVTISASAVSIAENAGVSRVTAYLSNPSYQDVTIQLATTGSATSGVDYVASSTGIVILAGQTSGSITLTSINDNKFETNESIIVDVTSVTHGCENGTQSITTSITNDDPTPTVTLSASVVSIVENAGVATVVARLSNPSYQDITVTLSLSGAATSGVDYSASSTTIVIPAGSTSGSITLSSINDITYEPNESIVVGVSSVTNGTQSGSQSATVSITNDDPIPAASLSINSTILAENSGVNTVTARIANPSSQDITITLTLTGTATLGSDYSASAANIVIPAGQTAATITLTGIADGMSESVETIVVDIASVTGGVEAGVQQATTRIGTVFSAATQVSTPDSLVDSDRYSVNGRVLTIRGSAGVDDIRLIRSSATQFYVNYGGESLIFSTETINQVVVATQGGRDQFTMIGSNNMVETVTINPASLTYSSTNLTVQSDAEVEFAFGQSNDSATLNDSTGNDVYFMRREYGYMIDRANTYLSQPIGFGSVVANASGGSDQVITYVDGGRTLTMTPVQTWLASANVTLVANNFEYQVGQSLTGTETLNMTGSAGNDTFVRSQSSSTLTVGANYQQGIGFRATVVQSSGGVDVAYLYDSAGDDTYTASPSVASMQTPTSIDQVVGFKFVYAFASSGNDTANFDGSTADDNFYGNSVYSVLYSTGAYTLQAQAFDSVFANLSSGGGNDTAVIEDSAGDDTLTAAGNYAEMTYAAGQPTSRIRVTAFDLVYANGNAGGTNRHTNFALNYTLYYNGSWLA